MMKGEAARIISRRLNLSHGRVSALLVAASDAGILPKGSGKSNPRLSPLELSYLTLACIADRGIGVAGQSVREFAGLQSAEGLVLVDLIEAWISGRAAVAGLQSVIVQLDPAGVSISTAAHHLRYGASHAEGAARHVVIRGDDLAAAILEMQGYTPHDADEAVAVGRLAAALA
ncbi:hypothetical protein [Afipia sp. Root123D2]|uniref:hypothetical protein n=1 Tax=Afipia sp. Root123D2 TaxID=1736436 RepID=UPI000A907ECD|nr:hypothetical protein [Afipia sp. Root123D2]